MARHIDYPENLYEVLGLDPSASDEEVRRAGRRRQRETHPDLGGNAEEFTRVRLAVEVLSHPRHRAEHDAWLATTRGLPTPARTGVRLRQQQRAPRTAQPPRSPAQPAARHAAAGSEAPAFDRIPKPSVDVRRLGWYRRAWHRPAEVWPGTAPVAPPPSPRELATVLPFLLVSLAVVVLLALPMSPLATPWWPVAAVIFVGGLVWLVLRSRGSNPALANAIYWLVIAGSALSGALSFVDGMAGIISGGHDPLSAHVLRGVAALVVVALAMLAWWGLKPRARKMSLERLLMRLADESAPAADSEQQIYGTPGATAMTHSAPGVHPVRRQYAEQIVGEGIAALARIPGVRIVHGLRLPGGDPEIATISTAILAGRRLALIDDELRATGDYAVDARGALTRNGSPVNGTIDFPHRVERLHEYFGDVAEVRGWLTIVPDAPGEFTVDNARTWARVRLATVESMLREAGDWLAEDGNRVDRLLLRDLLELQVTP